MAVGSIQDPFEYQGLAHFCEHMLFLGTEKYPVENHYGKFISEHGGRKNATTSLTRTYYYFNIANEHLSSATDIFSQFFKWPLFTESATEREINAVDSEFRKNYNLDSRKLFQIFKSHAANPLSHYAKFQTGNLDTLSKPDIRDQLIKFHSNYYSSNLMGLCIYGKDSIEALEELAVLNFEDVEDKQIELDKYIEPHPFPKELRRKIFKIVPAKHIGTLDIRWILPSTKQLYKSKPGHCISFILGHEGTNSLLSYLIKEGLGSELTSSYDHLLDAWDKFQISIKLTEKGEKEYTKVLKIVFAAINHLKSNEIRKYIYDEEVTMNHINFENKAKDSPLNVSADLANRIRSLDELNISMDRILYYPYILEEFDEEAIKSQLNEMTPENWLVFFSSKDNEEIADKTEVIYNTKFHSDDIEQSLLDELAGVTFESIESEFPKAHDNVFDYPPKNNFIPYNIQNLKSDAKEEFKLVNIEGIQNCKVWYKRDDSYEQPKINTRMVLRTADLNHNTDAKSKIFKKLWVDMIDENIREISYFANLAKIIYSIDSNAEGIAFYFHGFNDGIQNFIEEVLKCCIALDTKLAK